MTKKMLIDATSAQETRVAVVDGGRLEEFDYEAAARKALKGNIYLAKVTRVEPSLQACFVEYGGNRHGFLPFGDIHPDYFRIPVADREAFEAAQREALERAAKAEEEAVAADSDDEPEDEGTSAEEQDAQGDEDSGDNSAEDAPDASEEDDKDGTESDEESKESEDGDSEAEEGAPESEDDEDEEQKNSGRRGRGRGRGRGGRRGRGGDGKGRRQAARSKNVETLGGDHAYEEELAFRFDLRRQYKIQEVIQRGQIMLIQASREERGNKGAAVTTYLSLPGRYCVLMPNSPRGGGVSRKIATHADRTRMRDMLQEMAVPQGMSVILRTAGMSRTKAEVKRDLDYLMRLWDDLRAKTLESSAPALIYEEGNLIKRAVRDLYTREIEEVVVAGEDGYKTARDFMKMMIPSHLRRVKAHEGDIPLFTEHGIEAKIAAMAEPEVELKSGGSIVISPTEALVAIDVNSGRATKGRHIEETALRTNLEAADAVARQLRLRDLGGLIVVDFIDMDRRGNNAKVERRLKDALAGDRARIQVGRISSFGLLEMSRQRINPSLGEVLFDICPACAGLGRIRSSGTSAAMLLRDIEAAALKSGAGAQITAQVPTSVALHMLNVSREALSALEARHGVTVSVEVDAALDPSDFTVKAFGGEGGVDPQPRPQAPRRPRRESKEDEDGEPQDAAAEDEDKLSGARRRGRRGGRRRRRNEGEEGASSDAQVEGAAPEESSAPAEPESEPKAEKRAPKEPKPKPEPKAEPQNSGPCASVEYEVVSEAPPSKKKKGWWNRLID